MKYKQMTATGIDVSRMCLGTMNFGGKVNEKDAAYIIDAAIDMGINFIDTANVYEDGASEFIIGNTLGSKRESVILATKVRLTRHPERLNEEGLSRRAIFQAVDKSLQRLRTDYIDLYYLHTPDERVDIEETADALGDLITAGKIRYYGVSNYASWQLSDLVWTAKSRRHPKPLMTENVYNLLCRSIEPELVPCIKKHKIGMTVFNPLAGGMLAGRYMNKEIHAGDRFDRNKMYLDRYWNEDSFKGVEMLAELAHRYGMSMAELSIRWCAQHDFVDSTIVGVSQLAHLKENIAYFDKAPLSEEVMQACDEVWKAIAGTRYQYNR